MFCYRIRTAAPESIKFHESVKEDLDEDEYAPSSSEHSEEDKGSSDDKDQGSERVSVPESTPKKKPIRVRDYRVFSDDSSDDSKEGNVPHKKPVKPKAVKKE